MPFTTCFVREVVAKDIDERYPQGLKTKDIKKVSVRLADHEGTVIELPEGSTLIVEY